MAVPLRSPRPRGAHRPRQLTYGPRPRADPACTSRFVPRAGSGSAVRTPPEPLPGSAPSCPGGRAGARTSGARPSRMPALPIGRAAWRHREAPAAAGSRRPRVRRRRALSGGGGGWPLLPRPPFCCCGSWERAGRSAPGGAALPGVRCLAWPRGSVRSGGGAGPARAWPGVTVESRVASAALGFAAATRLGPHPRAGSVREAAPEQAGGAEDAAGPRPRGKCRLGPVGAR